ncbi:DUF5908 family protein [Aquimarina agarivorans]|uniref:DUF5908 family protein n=1 Tax=Aquimarina agarivorans TaxID=980584 RepID=UPI0002EE5ADF|nr:DUF5908 family protein [Aquimarina agarivorans]
MPIEIRELIIKATLENGGASASPSISNGAELSQIQLNEIASKIFEIIEQKLER